MTDMLNIGEVKTSKATDIISSLAPAQTKGNGNFKNFMENSKLVNKLDGKLDKSSESVESVGSVKVVNDKGKFRTTNVNEKGLNANQATNEEVYVKINKAIKDIVKDTLDMDEKDIEAAMETMGIAPVDLLNTDVLKDFILFVNGELDSTNMLLDESLTVDFTLLLENIQSIDFVAVTQVTNISIEDIFDLKASLEMAEMNADSKSSVEVDPGADPEVLDQKMVDFEALAGQEVADAGSLPKVEDVSDGEISKAFVGEENPDLSSALEATNEEKAVEGQEIISENPDFKMKEGVNENLVYGETEVKVKEIPSDELKGQIVLEGNNQTKEVKAEPEIEIKNFEGEVKKTENMSQSVSNSGDSSEESESESLFGQADKNGQEILSKDELNPQIQTENTFQSRVETLSQVTVTETRVITTRIIQQIVQHIRVNLTSDMSSIEMQLNPESLGKVLLSIHAKEGVMTANFTVQSEEARYAIESQMMILRESLEEKEIKVEAVEVTVSNFDFNRNSGQDDNKDLNHGNGKQDRYSLDSDEETEEVSKEAEAERVRKNVMRDNGSSIDYTA